jgi:hypothetical protein
MSVHASLFGDWHGNGGFATHAIAIAAQLRPADARFIHVGDMGLYPGLAGHSYLSEVNAAVARAKRYLYVVPGNHEHWPSLCIGSELGFTGYDEHGFLVSATYPRLRVSPRVNVWEWDGLVYASLSGANSIDFQFRTEGRSWWRDESPTDAHVDKLTSLVGERQVDILITHDAPLDAIDAMNLYPRSADAQSWWSPLAVAYARESSRVIGVARARLAPRVHVCGHHHVRRSVRIDGTAVELLGDDGVSVRGNRLDLAGTDVIR